MLFESRMIGHRKTGQVLIVYSPSLLFVAVSQCGFYLVSLSQMCFPFFFLTKCASDSFVRVYAYVR